MQHSDEIKETIKANQTLETSGLVCFASHGWTLSLRFGLFWLLCLNLYAVERVNIRLLCVIMCIQGMEPVIKNGKLL